MGGTLEYTIDTLDSGIGVFHLAGRVDITSANDLKQALAREVASGHQRLLMDLQGVSFVDSSGLSAFVSGLRVARQAGGDLRIAAPGEQPKAVLALTSLDRIFSVYPTVEEAVDGYTR
jgi:anti-sigma B factor antagonist